MAPMAPQAEAMGDLMPFNDDILAEFLIRLPTLEDLGRACLSCATFHRVITKESFLRRLHALRPPSLLGFTSSRLLFYPAELPHPSARIARAVEEDADFQFSFLPTMERGWTVHDGRDGRFVFDCHEGDPTLATIAVCDPLFRSDKLIPPLPERFAALGRRLLPAKGAGKYDYGVFLAPCSGAPGAFSVIWMIQSPIKLIVFRYFSASEEWQSISSKSRHDLDPTMPACKLLSGGHSYAYGCFYWRAFSKLVVLDMGRKDFYAVDFTSNNSKHEKVAIVELGESRLGLFVVCYDEINEKCIVELFSASNQIHGEAATEWVPEKSVSLPASSNFSMLGVADGKLLLQGAHEHNSEEKYGCISLDFKTGLVQKFRRIIKSRSISKIAQYVGYPRSLSLPTI